ncbi:hypothetical protein EOA32_01100 [Mesorhizobium sp. M1A.F.Ca.ET.072.01.1.1]|uniref:hypothetical protein n=1 Tax=Mesorhizobium sp. M1A.F.Ca.ET.072.01.1.1 TaxID=2496753 RepID=UPI000FD3B12D|nr:hypothetical protein [Mesorhizobium sp. M1A.F.Ca.ET.072.01.1.1]RUW55647.1 hypothetical protein EOA32_01100 [Mesorhizobium sp. M1A.F.Ca.ET.072.01.1.1]
MKCDRAQPATEFAKHSRICKQCKRDQHNEWRENNKGKIAEQRKGYWKRYREQYAETIIERRNSKDNIAKSLFGGAKLRARASQLSFNICLDHVRILLELGTCQKSGLVFDLSDAKGKRRPFGPSLDRKDNSRGYEPDNIQLVCNLYNVGKNEHDELDFIAMCLAVAARNQNNNAAIARFNELLNARL